MKSLNTIKQLGKTIYRNYSSYLKTSRFGIIDIPEVTLTKYLFDKCDKTSDRSPFITCARSGRTFTYGETKALSKIISNSLTRTVGLKEKDVIGLILPNTPEFPVTVFGSLMSGQVVTFINPLFTSDEIANQFTNAEVKCIVTIPELTEKAEKVKSKLKDYRGTIILDKEKWEYNGSSLTLDQDTAANSIITSNTHDPAILPYSSGTTGVPKGVMLSHYSLISNIEQVIHPPVLGLGEEDYLDVVLNIIPFFHIYGFNGIMNLQMALGSHIITIPQFTPEDYIEALKKYEPTNLYTVPSLLSFIANHPGVKPEYLRNVKRITTGAAPATKSLVQKIYDKLPNKDTVITQGYGMTESSPATLITPKNTPLDKFGSTGVLLPLTEARIVCLETGKDLPSNKQGELFIRGPQVMTGYFKNPKATKETIDGEGWLHTGDVAYYDDDDFFYIVDRTKELIKVKGNQVSPTEIESKILEIDDVADVAVIGKPDEEAGELPRAFIVRKVGGKITSDEIHKFLQSKLAPYKRLAGGIKFIEAIPRNHAGKILRKQLAEIE